MIKAQCINQHWFDAEKYTFCPHCGAGKAEEKELENTNRKEPQRKTLRGFLFGNHEIGTSVIQRGAVEPFDSRADLGQGMFRDNLGAKEQSDFPKTELLITPRYEQSEIKTVSSDNYVLSYVFSDEEKVPTAAWLVGIGGKRAGRSYVIKLGVNRLADRGESGATITYEVEKRRFWLSGDETEIYCNGYLVGSKRELNAYDVIEIQNEKYMFVPFCGVNFDWSNINN